jgi:NADPH:quinone reductase-like Zn-dependent oxidoreductase
MRAVVYDRYGPPEVQRLEKVEQPVPKDDEVLIKIHATTVNRTDCEIRDANRRNGWAVMLFSRLLTGLRRPKQQILGSELAGEVVAIGAAVRDFAAGDRVFGVNAWKLGAHAEYMCMRESGALAPMPARVTFEEAAAVCDGGSWPFTG